MGGRITGHPGLPCPARTSAARSASSPKVCNNLCMFTKAIPATRWWQWECAFQGFGGSLAWEQQEQTNDQWPLARTRTRLFFFFGLWMLEVGVLVGAEAGWVFGTPQSIDKHWSLTGSQGTADCRQLAMAISQLAILSAALRCSSRRMLISAPAYQYPSGAVSWILYPSILAGGGIALGRGASIGQWIKAKRPRGSSSTPVGPLLFSGHGLHGYR